MATFEQAVLHWLTTTGGRPDAREVTEVVADGSEWAGSTEQGFHDSFEIYLSWLDADDVKRTDTVSGAELESLWRSVVGAWPKEQP